MAILRKIIALGFILLIYVGFAAAQEGEGDNYMRIAYDSEHEPQAMQTSIVTYVPGPNSPYKDVSLDMISAVHVGEVSYFEALNKRFDNYEALLYELIAEKGTVPKPDPNKEYSFIAAMQLSLTEVLQLEYQLHGINYDRPHFVHADKSPDEFIQSMRDKNESFVSLFMKIMSASYAEQSKNPNYRAVEAKLMLALMTKDPAERAKRLKRLMASQFRQSDMMIEALNGAEGSTIISGRNDTALEVLKEQIKAGKKKIGIFYGAGHMPDFHEKLTRDFGFTVKNVEWIEAWDLR